MELIYEGPKGMVLDDEETYTLTAKRQGVEESLNGVKKAVEYITEINYETGFFHSHSKTGSHSCYNPTYTNRQQAVSAAIRMVVV